MLYDSQGAALPDDPSAIEEELRRLGYNMSAGTASVLPSHPNANPTLEPEQSAVAALLASRTMPTASPPPDAAPPIPTPTPTPTPVVEEQANRTPAAGGGIPWWMVPLLMGGGALLRGRGKGLARVAKEIAKPEAPKAKVGAKAGTVVHGPPKPGPKAKARTVANVPKSLPAPAALLRLPAPKGVELVDGALPPPTLTQTDVPSVSQALADRARVGMRGPVSDRMPTPPTPRPVVPPYTAALDPAKDVQGSELAKAIRVAGSVARERAKSAAKTEKLGKKRPPAPQRYTPDYRVPQEEGERKSFNEVVQAIRDAKNPPKIVKDLKPWLKEIKKDIGQPVLPKKKPGPKPKPKYKEVPEVAKALGKRKVETARRSKRTPKTLSERGKGKK